MNIIGGTETIFDSGVVSATTFLRFFDLYTPYERIRSYACSWSPQSGLVMG